MNKILKYLLAGAALWGFVPFADAQTSDERPDYIYVPEVIVDDQGKATVEVWLNTYVTQYNAFAMNVYLPEGFEIDKDRRGNFAFKPNTADDVLYDHSFMSEAKDGYVRLVAGSASISYIMPGNNMIFSFGITGPANYDKWGTGWIRKPQFAEDIDDTAIDHDLADTSFAVHPLGMTGVEDVASADAGTVTVYNLQGIVLLRDADPSAVRTLPPGLYIVNGRKTFVR